MSYVDFIIPGYDWHSPQFQIKTDGIGTDITGWTLTANFFWRGRNSSALLDPTEILLSVASGSSSFTIVDDEEGTFKFDLTADQTDDFDLAPDKFPGPKRPIAIRLSRTDGGLREFIADIKVEVRF